MKQPTDKDNLWPKVRALYSDVWAFLTRDIWSLDLTKLSRLQAFGIKQAKVLIFVLRQFYSDKLLIRASSLTYSSLLAIVPFLAVIFSILKAIGLHMDLAPALYNFLSPLGERGNIISEKILEFVTNAQTSTLGLVGTAILLFTVYGILNKIEGSYNDIWHVSQGRTWPRRLAGYTLLTMIGPLSLFLILALTASIASLDFVRNILSIEHLAWLFTVLLKLMPYALSCLLFSIVIWFVPNIRVSIRAALIGGTFSGILGPARGISSLPDSPPYRSFCYGSMPAGAFCCWEPSSAMSSSTSASWNGENWKNGMENRCAGSWPSGPSWESSATSSPGTKPRI
jgi:membrane protein